MSAEITSIKHRLFHSMKSAAARVAALCGVLALASCGSTQETLIWDWSYYLEKQSASQVVASGTFVTEKTPDSEGFYTIIGITGNRLGVAIKSLHPAGTAIPDNEPYKLDNRVRPPNPGGQLTKAGFGYGLANGIYDNPFYADFRKPPAYMAFLSKPPFGMTPPNTEEPTIVFQATIR